jgi:hypothetical protein
MVARGPVRVIGRQLATEGWASFSVMPGFRWVSTPEDADLSACSYGFRFRFRFGFGGVGGDGCGCGVWAAAVGDAAPHV